MSDAAGVLFELELGKAGEARFHVPAAVGQSDAVVVCLATEDGWCLASKLIILEDPPVEYFFPRCVARVVTSTGGATPR